MLNFVMYNLDDERIPVDNVLSYEFSRDSDAPCDAVRLSFISEKSLDEIYRLEVYDNGSIVFNGFVDTQRECLDDKGFTTFIYARSSACILVDNEAEPRSYYKPSLLSLFEIYAEDFGFESALDDICCNSDYLVSKGMSCYEAINGLVHGITGKNIHIDANNRLAIPDEEQKIFLSTDDILSEKRIINRGNAISLIDYKINNELEYNYHLKSRYMESQKINRKRKVNIAALPVWQRDTMLKNMLSRSCEHYNTIELVLSGAHMYDMDSIVEYDGRYSDSTAVYYLVSCKIICDADSERTKLTLVRKTDLEEISYVAE